MKTTIKWLSLKNKGYNHNWYAIAQHHNLAKLFTYRINIESIWIYEGAVVFGKVRELE